MEPQMTKRTWEALPGHMRRELALARWAAQPRREPPALMTLPAMNHKDLWFDDFWNIAGATVLYWTLVTAVGAHLL